MIDRRFVAPAILKYNRDSQSFGILATFGAIPQAGKTVLLLLCSEEGSDVSAESATPQAADAS